MPDTVIQDTAAPIAAEAAPAADNPALSKAPTGNAPPAPAPTKAPETPEDKAAKEAEAAAKEAEAKKAEEEAAKKTAAEWEGEYVTIDDPVGQAVVDILKSSGLAPKDANVIFADAIAKNNPDLVDWDALKKHLKPAEFTLAKSGVYQYHQNTYSQNMADIAYAHETVGGEKNWDKIKTWSASKSAVDPDFARELAGIRKGVDAHGKTAQAAINLLVEMYNADPKNVSVTKGGVVNGTKAAAPGGKPITRAEYTKLLDEASRNHASKAEIDALRLRRAAGLKAGI